MANLLKFLILIAPCWVQVHGTFYGDEYYNDRYGDQGIAYTSSMYCLTFYVRYFCTSLLSSHIFIQLICKIHAKHVFASRAEKNTS